MSLLNPRRMIEDGILQGITSDKAIQPNAVDVDCVSIYTLSGSIELSETGKSLPSLTKLEPIDGFWYLEPNTAYDCSSSAYCEIPEGVAATLHIRSTLNRGGIRLSSGIYDSGFKGSIAYVIHVGPLPLKLGVGTRVAQVACWSSDSEGKYAGGYNHEKGRHWASETGRFDGTKPNESNVPKSIEESR